MGTVLEWYTGGGPFMLPLLVVGVCGLALLVERGTHVMERSRVNARPFMEHVLTLVRAQKHDDALAACAGHKAILADLGIVILRSRDISDADLVRVADAARRSFIPPLRRRLGWLIMLALVALLIGVASAAEGHPRGLSAAALCAIPLVAGYAVLDNQIRTLTTQLEEFSARLINAVAGRPEVRLGHRS